MCVGHCWMEGLEIQLTLCNNAVLCMDYYESVQRVSSIKYNVSYNINLRFIIHV